MLFRNVPFYLLALICLTAFDPSAVQSLLLKHLHCFSSWHFMLIITHHTWEQWVFNIGSLTWKNQQVFRNWNWRNLRKQSLTHSKRGFPWREVGKDVQKSQFPLLTTSKKRGKFKAGITAIASISTMPTQHYFTELLQKQICPHKTRTTTPTYFWSHRHIETILIH